MNLHELCDRLDTWLALANQSTSRQSSNLEAEALRVQVEGGVRGGLLRNASELQMVSELVGTPAEQPLTEAIELAKRGDASHLARIQQLLQYVQKYIRSGAGV